ncbi:glycoside hydrolase family 5 protein [Hyphomicrobium sp.]|uniref:glycoside hydrolase family 5 protein n=1 Tax=Hyphomicrobium sp. TaxID=82 RepID=UPI0025BB2B18|nr:glycoside hydrolase family 5 protein [Hyphomicrobium sp.]MCC7251284.1 glycoside hydrolase family 5 protein [Hyphomicrobium sp.]
MATRRRSAGPPGAPRTGHGYQEMRMGHKPTRRTVLGGGLALTLGGIGPGMRGARAAAPTRLAFAGVNLAGAEFGKVPGRHTFDYAYPPPATIDYYAGLGFNVIRVPFRWERLQPRLGEALATDEQARLAAVVAHASAKGQSVIIDPHNYARRRVETDNWAREHFIGTDAVPTETFADFWRRLAEAFKGNPRAIFGLMNEPAGIAVDAWLPAADAAVKSIRETQASNLILVPGIDYAGAHSWISSGNVRMRAIADPADNFAFEVHQYLDGDSSGTSPEAVSATIGSERIRAFQDWAREHQFKAFLGEFGAADNERSLAALRDLCRTLEDNADVWLGWAAWAGGSWWPEDYFLNLEPAKDGRARKQTEILAEHARRVHSG